MKIVGAVAAVLVSASGCGLLGSDSSGFGPASSSNHPAFYFSGCPDEFCTTEDWNFAAGGATSTILSNIEFATVTSSDPWVATFVPDSGQIAARTGAPGTTTLDALDAQGRVLASQVVTVEATQFLTVIGADPPRPALVLEGVPYLLHLDTRDASFLSTRGDGSVAFTLTGTLNDDELPIDGDEIGFVGTTGSGSIEASCIDATFTQPVTVVAQSDITGLVTNAATAASGAPAVTSFEADANGVATVLVTAMSDLGPIYAGQCQWTVSDPSVVVSAVGSDDLGAGAADITVFVLERPGSYTATCSLAGRSVSVTLSF